MICLSNEFWRKLWHSECFISYDGLVPPCAIIFLCCLRIIKRIWMKVQVSWLNEFVDKVDWVWLFVSNQLAPSHKQVVNIQSTVVLIGLLVYPPDYSASFLNGNHVQGKHFDATSRQPFDNFGSLFGNAFLVHELQRAISYIKAICYHVALCNLSN